MITALPDDDLSRLAWAVLGVLASHVPDPRLAAVLGDSRAPIPLPSIVAAAEENEAREAERKKPVPWTRKKGRDVPVAPDPAAGEAPKPGKRQRKPLALGQPSPDVDVPLRVDDDGIQAIRASAEAGEAHAPDEDLDEVRELLEEATADA